MPDVQTITAAEFSDRLRRWLRSQPEPPQVQAGGIVYELAALIARHAATERDAERLLEGWVRCMRDQIRTLGVGVEHP